jgi:hypothetical protein
MTCYRFMTVSPLFGSSGFGTLGPQVVDDAYRIAWNYLLRSGQVFDQDASHLMLLEEISRLVVEGEAKALRLANKAISAYERRLASEQSYLAGA